MYKSTYSSETGFGFKTGLAAGIFAKASKSCMELLKDKKDKIVAKYTAINRKPSSRRILDESIYSSVDLYL